MVDLGIADAHRALSLWPQVKQRDDEIAVLVSLLRKQQIETSLSGLHSDMASYCTIPEQTVCVKGAPTSMAVAEAVLADRNSAWRMFRERFSRGEEVEEGRTGLAAQYEEAKRLGQAVSHSVALNEEVLHKLSCKTHIGWMQDDTESAFIKMIWNSCNSLFKPSRAYLCRSGRVAM